MKEITRENKGSKTCLYLPILRIDRQNRIHRLQ